MAEPKMMEGKVVVVTGAGRGIGAAIAKLAAQKGAKVIINDIDSIARPAKCRRTINQLILHLCRFDILFDLPRARLPHVNNCQSLQMLRMNLRAE